MKARYFTALIIAAPVVITGCQTINASTTPSLYKVQQSIADMVVEKCIVQDTKDKIFTANVFNVKYDRSNAGWVTAVANNSVVRVQGDVALNLYTGESRCGSRPKGEWVSLTDPVAEQLLSGRLTGSSIRPSSRLKPPVATNDTVRDRLKQLQYLLDQGLISEGDASVKRREILESL